MMKRTWAPRHCKPVSVRDLRAENPTNMSLSASVEQYPVIGRVS